MTGTSLSSCSVPIVLSRTAVRRHSSSGLLRLRVTGPLRVPRTFKVYKSASQDDNNSATSATSPFPNEDDVATDGALGHAEDVASDVGVTAIATTSEAIDAGTSEPSQKQVSVTAPSDDIPFAMGIMPRAQLFLHDNPVAGFSIAAILGFMGVTFVVAIFRTFARGVSPTGKRRRTVNKNKDVVNELSNFLPTNRQGLSGGVITGLRLRTGFSPVEIFRKYLWYLLRERKFDQDAVADMVALKGALKLNDDDIASALKERAKRVYEKYGNVMLDTEGMSAAGIERKATARALFSKLLYFVECEDLLPSDKASEVDLRDIFGATEDDASRLRIATLYEVDLDVAMGLPSAEGGSVAEGDEE